MPSYIEPNRFSLDQASDEASKISEMVGDKGESKDYAEAQTSLTEKQTRERLEGRDWSDVLPYAVSQFDSAQVAHKESSSLEYRLGEKQKDLARLSKDLERKQSDLQLLEEASDAVAKGGTKLSLALYGDTLYLGMMNFANDKTGFELERSIIDKLSDAHKEKQDFISLSPAELEFFKSAIPEILNDVKHRIPELSDSIDQCISQINNFRDRQEIASEASRESQEKLRASLFVLDEIEESLGAPPFKESTASTEE